jgi:hypothetical protein
MTHTIAAILICLRGKRKNHHDDKNKKKQNLHFFSSRMIVIPLPGLRKCNSGFYAA